MLPAAPLLLPVSALLFLIYKYYKSGRKTEFSEGASVPSTYYHHPQPAPPDLDPAILEEILKLHLKDIEEQEEKDRKTCDGKETEIEIDPAILDGILKLYFKKKAEKEEAQKSCDGPETETGNENGNERQKEEKEKENGAEVEKKVVEENSERYEYPLRPEAGDCVKYLKTGTCKVGSNCNFNHPRGRKNPQVSKDKAKERGESAKKPGQSECKVSKDKAKKDKAKERGDSEKKPGQSKHKVSKGKAKERGDSAKKPGQAECKYFLSGRCNYGKDCKFNHSREELELNFLGLPIRPGKEDCWDYMKNLSCKDETNCMYNHPDPTTTEESDPPSRYGNGVLASSQGALPPDVMNNTVTETKVYEQYPQQKKVEEFPERPGQPIYTPFSRTGDCKSKFNSKYHHPKNQTAVSHPCELSDKGLPLRPDRNICTHYSHYGSCNVGAACKFDHPTM